MFSPGITIMRPQKPIFLQLKELLIYTWTESNQSSIDCILLLTVHLDWVSEEWWYESSQATGKWETINLWRVLQRFMNFQSTKKLEGGNILWDPTNVNLKYFHSNIFQERIVFTWVPVATKSLLSLCPQVRAVTALWKYFIYSCENVVIHVQQYIFILMNSR